MFVRLVWMVRKKDTRVYNGSGRMSLRPVRAACALALNFAAEVTNGRERKRAPKSLAAKCCVGK
jgi:hypothetical protein